ncbi:MAG: WD40/YVTN/BNR-like repeat-containing protein [Thermoanaerobaculia bacterium]
MSRTSSRLSPVSVFILHAPLAAAVCLALLLALAVAPAPAPAQANGREAGPGPLAASGVPDELLAALEWREVGPYRGGRSAAVAGIPGVPNVYYFGATGGGVWKTEDGGTAWKNVSDGWFGGSIGAVAVSAWDPNVVYVGTGEKTVRGNVSHGDGVWKSTDAGRTWTHVGLAESRHVSRIRIHPKDPDRVYAAALGHLYGPNEERGVFRSTDGGETWERVLFVDEHTGAVDLVMDPTNPRVLYASFWQVQRTPWSLESGGPGSSLWKSTDGGDTWAELTENDGLPEGTWGISGVAVSPTDPDTVYAIVEAEEGGVFRSRDGGETWRRTNAERKLRQRAWYYTRIYADPADAESVYVLNVRFWKSKDGGESFESISTPHGDNHDLWIAPEDPLRMIEANDGGANVTFDGGETWSTQANQPTAQMYRVSTDDDFPYRLLGGQQDNSTVRIRSRSAGGWAVGVRDWEPTAGGESGYVVAKPGEPDVVYGGSYGGFLVRVDHDTGETRAVNVWPDDPMGAGAGEQEYRFQWNFPLFFSPHDPDVLYAAANVLFRTTDGGQSWEAISPDLTRAVPETLGSSGGPITQDNTSVEYYATIFYALESPHEPGVLWAGSDDGLVHLSRDGGESWTEVTPDWPEWMQVNAMDAHPFEPGGLYVAGTRYKSDDFTPYLYKTTDWGETWTRIDSGIPRDHFTRVIRADPDRPGLLYAGTERGVHVSFDDGSSWRSLQLELPVVPVTDLAVHEKDLVAATQGRGFWILDDLSPLHQVGAEMGSAVQEGGSGEPALLAPRAAYRLRAGRAEDPGDAGTNPAPGAWIHYVLPADLEEDADVRLEVLEPDGDLVRAFVPKPEGDDDGEEGTGDDGAGEAAKVELERLEPEPGLNRLVWDLEYPGAESFPGMILWNRNLNGPTAVPGEYRARLSAGEWSAEVPFEVLPDPRTSATPEDFRAQFEFVAGVRDKLTETHREIRRIRDVRGQVEDLTKRLEDAGSEPPEELRESADALVERITEIEEVLYQTKNQSRQDPLNFPIRLNDKLANLLGLASVGDSRPTDQMLAVRDELVGAIDAELAELRTVWDEDLPELNRLASEAGVAAVLLPE